MSKTKKITQIVEGKTKFLATGTTLLKIKDEYVELPIRSTGVVELQRELDRSAPTPPTKEVKVNKGSVYERRFGMEAGSVVRVFDMTDKEFREELKEYNMDFYWRIVIHSLDVEWQLEDGTELDPEKDFEKVKKILINSGITGHHLDKVVKDVGALTSDREDMADFLLKNSSGYPVTY